MRKTKIAVLIASLLPLTGAFAQSPEKTLPEVKVTGRAETEVVNTTAGPVDGYRALTATGATGTETPINQIPQSIQVIPRSVILDQNNLSVTEAVRNASGTSGTNVLQTPAYNSTYIRGLPAENWVDGMTNYYNAGDRDSLVNVERIEVLKGPNAILYGGGAGAPLGGAINVVSKLPENRAFYEAGITVGSHRFAQPYLDFNQPLTEEGTARLRITGEYTTSHSFVDVIDQNRYAIFPTLLVTNNAGTTLTLQGRFTSWKQEEYQGLPATGTVDRPFTVSRDLFAGPSNIPKSYSRVQSGTATLDHSFNDTWSAHLQARAAHTEFRELAQNYVGTDFAANAPSFPPSSWNLLNILLYQEQHEHSATGHVQAKFSTENAKHKLLFGADYSRLKDDGYMLGDFMDLFTLGLVDLANNPSFPAYAKPANTLANTIVDGENKYTTKGIFAQWQASFYERLHLVAAVRRASLKIDSFTPMLSRSDVTDDTRTLPKVGALFDLVPGFGVFASYSEGMKGNPFVLYAGTPKPETSKQREAGVKFGTDVGLSGSAAVFNIDRDGVPVFTGVASEAIGKQRSRGYETDLLWQLPAGWQLLANYAHVNAELTKAIPGVAADGNQLNIVPRNSGRLWANYRFSGPTLAGWSAGAGLYAASGAYVDLGNTFKTSGYTTFDAKVAYETKQFTATVNVKNLTGAKYFVPFNYYGGRVATGDDRGVFAKVALRF